MNIGDNYRILCIKQKRLELKGDINRMDQDKKDIYLRIYNYEQELNDFRKKGYIDAVYEDFSVYKYVNTYNTK